MKCAIAGIRYADSSLTVLLVHHKEVQALEGIPETAGKRNQFKSSLQDGEIERFMAEVSADKYKFELCATSDVVKVYSGAKNSIAATLTNYSLGENYFDTTSVEAAVAAIRLVNSSNMDCCQINCLEGGCRGCKSCRGARRPYGKRLRSRQRQ